MKEYTGFISYGKTIGLVKKASICFDNQVRRCYCKTNPRFKTYGAKGIKIEYTKRQFIQWYLDNYKRRMKIPSVGRIDHSKNYKFDNIKFEELSDNSMERIVRCGSTKAPKMVNVFRYGKFIKKTNSLMDAAKLSGVHAGHIGRYCSGKINKSVHGFSFKYANTNDLYLNKNYIKKIRNEREIRIIDVITNTEIIKVNSYKEAANFTGIQLSHIGKYCRGEIKKSKKGYRLELIK